MTTKRTAQVITKVGYVGTPDSRVAQVITKVGYVGTPDSRVAQVITLVGYVEGAAPSGGQRFWAQVIG